MKNKFFGTLMILGTFLLLLWIEACGNSTGHGGTEAGNPDSREITGKVAGKTDAPSTKSVKAAATDSCVADTVLATDSAGASKSSDISATDCSFRISLATGKAFRITFNLSGSQVAALQFSTTTQLTTQTVIMGISATAIDLGLVSFSGTTATPQNDYFAQNDQDGDGIPDSQETDANGNGIADSQETDCDLDGIPDYADSDTSSCGGATLPATQAYVYEVDPRNEPSPSNPFFQVDLTASVKARASCEINQSTVTVATLTITSTTDTISCSFKFSGTGTGDRVECDHSTQNFQAATLYTATLNGVKCSDGRGIQSTTWSFKTK